ATGPGAGHLLVVGAYRDDEVDGEHALHALANAAEERAHGVPTITLAPLGDDALAALVGDLLNRPADELRGLTMLVKVKTDGSPFFVVQFLRALHERRLLSRDLETGRWLWNADRIERAGVTDNVVTLLSAKIGALSAPARQVLAIGACIGQTFEATLASAPL